jgi:hypothetical protein
MNYITFAIDMAGKEHSIVEQIKQSRMSEERRKASAEKAAKKVKENLPAFTEQLNKLILDHCPKPEVEEVEFDQLYSISYNGKEKTVLEAEIPTTKGAIVVSIESSSYPSGKKAEDDRIAYKINVHDLDHTLEIDENGAKLKSKKFNSSMPRDNPIIGHKYPSWPEWERNVKPDDLNRYSELLDKFLNSPDVKFSGTTPKEYRAKPTKGMGKIYQTFPQKLKNKK